MAILREQCRSYWFLLALSVAAGCSRTLPYEGKSVSQLEAMLADGDARAQTQAAHGLSLHGQDSRSAVPLLAQKLKAPQPILRQQAALALGRIGPDAGSAVPDLAAALADTEWTVRRQVVLALGGIGAAAAPALPQLDRLANDPDPLVRQAVQQARPRITGEK